MDVGDLEGSAEAIRQLAGVQDDLVSTPKIARRWLGPGSVELVPRYRMRTPARLARVGDEWRIFVREGLSPQEANFAVGHELGEHWLKREGYDGEDLEQAANYIGAALVAPRPTFVTAVRELGEDWTALSQRFVSTESLVVLRWGEIRCEPLALVSPALVRVRGPESFVWPEEPTIRRWANGRPGPGLRKARLADDRRRVVLKVEDVG
jgi:hypothetical protein